MSASKEVVRSHFEKLSHVELLNIRIYRPYLSLLTPRNCGPYLRVARRGVQLSRISGRCSRFKCLGFLSTGAKSPCFQRTGGQPMHAWLRADMEYNLTEHLQQQMSKEFNCNLSPSQPSFYNHTCHQKPDITLRSLEEDQVVPFSLRQTILGGLQREAKPLPPLPDPEELMSDEAADSEVEFFTSDQLHLLPKSCPKAMCRSTNRESGQLNYNYQKGLVHGCSAGISSMVFSWPCSEERATGMESGLSDIWSLTFQKKDQSEQNQSSRLWYSCTGTTFQPLYSSNTTSPKVPPRIPIPPKPLALLKTLRVNEKDKPPKIPPRIPLASPCPPRTPSPKSLPIYINGVMPATQSFAANPKYVSEAFQRQQSDRLTPAAQSTPCIVPILKDGRQTSATHYILLPPGRQAYSGW